MTEREVVLFVKMKAENEEQTDFSEKVWDSIEFQALQSCVNKGFIAWRDKKLVVTDLGRRSFGVQ